MKKNLFINPCIRPGATAKYPPVGLAYIIHAIQKNNIDFDFIDMDVQEMSFEDLASAIRGKDYNFCGFGCIVTGFRTIKEISRIVRQECPNCLIAAGNSVATSVPEILLRNTDVDVAVIGEGDETIVELITALENHEDWRNVKGIAYIDNNIFMRSNERPVIENLDEIGFPDWSIFDTKKYNAISVTMPGDCTENPHLLPLNGARGCLFNCSFCYHVFKGKKYRKYSESAIVKEFTRLTITYGATFIAFWDELSFATLNDVENMVLALEGLPFRTPWRGISRANLFGRNDVPLIKRMAETKCTAIAFSIENANPQILKAMNKNINHKKTIDHAHALHKGGVTPFTSLIFGYPQETSESIKQTLKLCEECGIYPSSGFLLPLPMTPIYDWARSNGFIKDELSYLMSLGDRQDLHINMTKMPTNEFVDCVTSGLNQLAKKLGLNLENALKTGVYQKAKNKSSD